MDSVTARIGMVNFINTAPFYEIWQQTVHRPEWQVTEASPAVLNKLLFEDKLDLGFISSHEYAAHPSHYKILGDLSISATGPVGSVFLFSKVSPKELSDKLVRLSPHSQTSVSLIKIILEEFYQVNPKYNSNSNPDQNTKEPPWAVLAIGDEALRIATHENYPVKLDLGEVWQQHTGLPFVFALWAVREDFCKKDPDAVVAIHQELLRCIAEGKKNLQDISTKVAPRIPMSPDACYAYLRSLEYDLGPEKQESLELFFNYLTKRGEGDPAAIPLKICG